MLKMGTTSVSAISKINGINVVYYSAQFSEDKELNYSITKNVANMNLYKENSGQCEMDYLEFEEKAKEFYELLKSKGEEA